MRGRLTPLIAVTICLVIGVLKTTAVAQPKSLKDQLIGTWVLISNDKIEQDGTRRQQFGPNPKGLMILDAGGRYTLIQIDPNRPKFKINNRLEGTPEENKAALRGSVAHFGTWSVDEAAKIFILNVEGEVFPNTQGTVSKRPITLTGDELKSTNLPSTGGTTETVFRRAK
jgi:hypothetical protein